MRSKNTIIEVRKSHKSFTPLIMFNTIASIRNQIKGERERNIMIAIPLY